MALLSRLQSLIKFNIFHTEKCRCKTANAKGGAPSGSWVVPAGQLGSFPLGFIFHYHHDKSTAHRRTPCVLRAVISLTCSPTWDILHPNMRHMQPTIQAIYNRRLQMVSPIPQRRKKTDKDKLFVPIARLTARIRLKSLFMPKHCKKHTLG